MCRRPRRKLGYFTLPVLAGDEIVAALDLKADRQAGKLLIQAWHWIGPGTRRDAQGDGRGGPRSVLHASSSRSRADDWTVSQGLDAVENRACPAYGVAMDILSSALRRSRNGVTKAIGLAADFLTPWRHDT